MWLRRGLLSSRLSFLALALVLQAGFLWGQTQGAQSEQSSKPTLQSINETLQQVEASLTTLELRLGERKTQIETLSTTLAQAQSELTALSEALEKSKAESKQAQASLTVSEAELKATSEKLESLSTRLSALELDFNNYKAGAEAEIKTLSIKIAVYKNTSIVLGIGLAGGGVWAVGHFIAKVW